MGKKGKNKYVPPCLLDEVRNVKSDEGLFSDAEAFKKIAGYSRVGRLAKKKGIL